MTEAKKIMQLPFKWMGQGLVYLFKGRVINSKSGADFESSSRYSDYLNSSQKGLILDGHSLCLSEQESFKNICVLARVGAGKTSRYIIPNVLKRASEHCSMVINDPKGEVFENTSGYLKRSGFNIIVIDPENLERSSQFNPLEEAKTDIEIEQVAEILVRSGNTSSAGKDEFWLQGAIRFVSLFIKCLQNAGQENRDWYNLHNLYYLFQNFGEDGSNLDDFMSRYTIYPDDPTDETLWNEWKGVLTGNKEGVQSFVLNAITALKSLSNKNLAKLTAKSDIELQNIRHEKTAIFLITPAQHTEYYSFLTSLFFRSVFNACMRKMPDKKDLNVYVLYDEFGHSTIPNFVSTANTIRGYRVSLSIILQSISQLNARYGKDYADSIQGGFNTYITYSGSDPQTTQFFENIIGKVRERQRKEIDDTTDQYREYNLMNASEIRTIQSDQALVVSSNRQPVLLNTKAYFENWAMKRKTSKPPVVIETNAHSQNLNKVSLK